MSSHPSLTELDAVLREIDQASATPRDQGGSSSHSANSIQESSSPFSHVERPLLEGPQDENGQVVLPSQGESTSTTTPILSFKLPATVRATAGDQTKYKLWRAPTDVSNHCFHLIGQGASFCIKDFCTINHKGSPQFFQPLPGELFVLRSPSTAFIAPKLEPYHLADSVIESWFSDGCTIDEWHRRFLLAKQEQIKPVVRDPFEEITASDLKTKDLLVNTTLAFKTPSRKKQAASIQLQVDIPEFKLILHELDSDRDIYVTLNKKFSEVGKTLETLFINQQHENNNHIEGLDRLDLKFSQLINLIGDRPLALDSKFIAPNLWLSFVMLADEVKKVMTEHMGLKRESNSIRSTLNSVSHKADELYDLKSNEELMIKQIKDLTTFSIESSRKLNDRISNLPSQQQSSTLETFQDEVNQKETLMLGLISKLESDIAGLRSNYDTDAIKFGQLGFRSAKDCDGWMELHHPEEDFGLLVDFHLVMEHLYVQTTGQKLMSNLEKVYKMSLRNNNQALAISSYEARVPRFFSGEARTYTKKDESYFAAIKTWDDWDLPNDGFRDRLHFELQLFKSGHQETLDAELTPLSPFYNLCVLALTESVSWVDNLVKFIDDTYNEYSRSRYGPKKAWHVTTRLAKALIERVAQPRNSIHNSFKINRPSEVSKSIAYSSLKSLDLMMKISTANFKNSPIITAELSKFLALNSNHEVVEKLQSKFSQIETESSSLRKEVKGAVTAANTASNKVDSSLKSTIDDLKKRIKSLESRN